MTVKGHCGGMAALGPRAWLEASRKEALRPGW